MALIAVIYAVYRYQSMKKIDSSAAEEDNGEEFVDYEEVD